MRAYPAYGRKIAALAARGVRPAAIGVLLSSRWWYFEHVARCCIRPDEYEPGRWEFSFLHDQHAVAIWGDDCEPWQFAWLLVELMAAGPRRIWALNAGGAWIAKTDEQCSGGTLQQYAAGDIRGDVKTWAGQPWRGPKFNDITPARRQYEAAWDRADERDARILERVLSKQGDVVALVKERDALKAYVEQLFSNPFPVQDERAA